MKPVYRLVRILESTAVKLEAERDRRQKNPVTHTQRPSLAHTIEGLITDRLKHLYRSRK